jgi:transcriptional regulator with XRE-family HTH domain
MTKEKTERSIDPKFSQVIRHRREEMKLSLSELSELTGISSSYLNRLEKGERKAPSFPIMQMIAKAMGMDISEVLNLASSSENEEIVPEIRELLLRSDFRVGDTFVTTEVKELLLKLVESIVSAEWEDEIKFIEGAVILQTVDRLKALV